MKPGLHPSLRAWPSFAMYEAARLVRAAAEAALAEETGLGWNDVVVLTVLDRFRQGLSHSALREWTCIDRTTLGRILLDLDYDGLVDSRPSLVDRRQLVATLTPAGKRGLEAARAVLEVAERDALRRLDARERKRLHQLAIRALPPREHPLADLFR